VTARASLVIAAVFLATVAGAAAAARTHLVISGAFHTSSARAVRGTFENCGYGQTRTLGYASQAFRIGRGPAVAWVQISFPRFRGRGRYKPTAPAPYGRTALQVVVGGNATAGAGGGFYVATSGTITVLGAKNVGRKHHAGSLNGTVHARLRLKGGTKRLRLVGSWQCRIDPSANGG